MTSQTYDNLHGRALQVMNETAGFANTEARVGSLFRDIIDTALVGGSDHIDPANYGALGDGAANDSAALVLAIAAGVAVNKPVSGLGKTYGVSGSLNLIAGAWLQDITLKQLSPGTDDSVRTLSSSGADDLRLVRVTVNRNGDGTNGSFDAAGIWISGGSRHYFEDVLVYGNDLGNGFAIHSSTDFDVVRLHVRNISYSLGADPGDDVVQGFWFNGCSNFRVISARAHDLGGNYGSGYTTKYSRNPFAGCVNFDLVDVMVWNVDQGIDLTGSDGNRDFRINGGSARDCYTTGFKFANSAKGGVVTGVTTERCDLYGFLVSGPAEAGITHKCGDITFVNCVAYDTGSVGNYTGGIRPAGFAVEINSFDAAISPLGIRFIGCTAHDRQTVPTMLYGFANEVARPADGLRLNQCIDSIVIGNKTSGSPYYGMHSAVDVSWQPNEQFPTRSKIASIEWTEHFTAVSAMRGMASTASGVGASFSDEPNDNSGRVGLANCRTGTDTTGSAGVSTRIDMMRFGGGRHRLRWDARLLAVSDGTDTFTTRIGFLDSLVGESTDGVFFRYTHSVNGGRWQAVTRAAGVETATDTTVAASTSWAYFEIEVNATGNTARFYIDGVALVSIGTNIPTGANLTGIGALHLKSAGVNNREFWLDLMAYSFEPSTLL